MEKWLNDNNISMYFTHNEGKPLVAYKKVDKNFEKSNLWKMTGNNKISSLGYLDKVAD